jgi:DNA-binding NtrC family response regulator
MHDEECAGFARTFGNGRSTPQMMPKQLLYVESSPAASLNHQVQLLSYGFDVRVAGSASSVLGLLSTFEGDAVVISHDPASGDRGNEGFRLAAAIKHLAPGMPVVMISACESVAADAPCFVDGAFWNKAPIGGLISMLQRVASRAPVQAYVA